MINLNNLYQDCILQKNNDRKWMHIGPNTKYIKNTTESTVVHIKHKRNKIQNGTEIWMQI